MASGKVVIHRFQAYNCRMLYEEWELSPFRGKTIEQFSPTIWHMDPGNEATSYVARVERGWNHIDVKNWERDLSLAKVARAEFNLLREFGVNIVPFEIIMSRDKGIIEACAYVEGGSITDAPEQEIDQTVTGLLGYYRHKFDYPKEPFMFDIEFAKQYMYGSIQGGDKKVYMVDIDVFRMYTPWKYPEPWIEIGKREDEYQRILNNINTYFIKGCGNRNRREVFIETANYMAKHAVYAESIMDFQRIAQSV